MLRYLLAAKGSKVGRRHVKTLMRRMGVEASYRRPRTTKPAPGHKIFPYLLRGLEIVRPNQVWAMDITTCPWRRASSMLELMVKTIAHGPALRHGPFYPETWDRKPAYA